jgi:hypothetical protein
MLLFGFGGEAHAQDAFLCQKPNGLVILRSECKKKEEPRYDRKLWIVEPVTPPAYPPA